VSVGFSVAVGDGVSVALIVGLGVGVSVGNIGTAPTQDERAKATSISTVFNNRDVLILCLFLCPPVGNFVGRLRITENIMDDKIINNNRKALIRNPVFVFSQDLL
jgi:hypothetical protein